jgi:hypothetical protein
MTRTIELECEVDRLRRMLRAMQHDPGPLTLPGCHDEACVLRAPDGPHTHSGCVCSATVLREAVRYYKLRCEYLQTTVEAITATPEELR